MRRFILAASMLIGMSAPTFAQYHTYTTHTTIVVRHVYHEPSCKRLRGRPALCVLNNSPYRIVHMTAIQHGLFGNYGTDLLNGNVVYPGEKTFIAFPACFIDVHVVTEDGSGTYFKNVDVCTPTNWTITRW